MPLHKRLSLRQRDLNREHPVPFRTTAVKDGASPQPRSSEPPASNMRGRDDGVALRSTLSPAAVRRSLRGINISGHVCVRGMPILRLKAASDQHGPFGMRIFRQRPSYAATRRRAFRTLIVHRTVTQANIPRAISASAGEDHE
jgi:hypothetical protein